MKSAKIRTTILLVLLFGVVSACSAIPAGINNLFATKTSTATSTATPTVTPTHTPTPGVAIELCAFTVVCPQAIEINAYLNQDAPQVSEIEVRIPYDQPILFYQDWHVLNDAMRNASLDHLQWIFTIDGQDYLRPGMVVPCTFKDVTIDAERHPCIRVGAVLHDWKIDEPHQVEIGYIVRETVNDGWHTFEAGERFVTTYNVIPTLLPTFTATPTVTLTPTITPTATKTSTARPAATKTTASSSGASGDQTLDLTIKVTNKCEKTREVVFSGPTALTFTLTAGQSQQQKAAQGTYYWTLDGFLRFGPLDIYTTSWALTLCK